MLRPKPLALPVTSQTLDIKPSILPRGEPGSLCHYCYFSHGQSFPSLLRPNCQSCPSVSKRSATESRPSLCERDVKPANRFWPLSLVSASLFRRFVSHRHFPREFPM